jgi:hypothetical protein
MQNYCLDDMWREKKSNVSPGNLPERDRPESLETIEQNGSLPESDGRSRLRFHESFRGRCSGRRLGQSNNMASPKEKNR